MTTPIPENFTFGSQVAADYTPPSEDAVWIRYFKDPVTILRLIPMEGVDDEGNPVFGVEAWPTEREHIDNDIKMSYVCVERFGTAADCKGCQSNNERTRERKRAYYFRAYDDKGYQRVYKCGRAVFKILKARQQRKFGMDPTNLQPLSDADIVVSKTGRGFDTLYDVDTGKQYDVDWPEDDDLLDIQAALSAQWRDAMDIYDGHAKPKTEEERLAEEAAKLANRVPDDKTGAAAQPDRTGATAKKATTRAPAKKAATAPPKESPLAKAVADHAATNSDTALGEHPTDEEMADAELSDLRYWLEQKDVEFPSNAPRSRLIKAIKAKLEEVPF